MTLWIEVKKITLNKDRTTLIDEEHLEVTKFKRAVVEALVGEDEHSTQVGLILDIRARVLTIASKNPDIALGKLGVGILREYQLVSGYDAVQLLREDPQLMKDTGRFPVGPDVDQFLGFIHLLMERGRVELPRIEPSAALVPGTTKVGRIPVAEKTLFLKGLASTQLETLVQSAIDLKAMSYRFTLLEDPEVVEAVDRCLKSNNEEVTKAIVEMLLGTAQSGSQAERVAEGRWIPPLRRIATLSGRADVAGKAFYILLLHADPSSVDVLQEWVSGVDDTRWAGLNVSGFLRTPLKPELRFRIRQGMYELLETGVQANAKNRIAEILDIVRWT